MAQSRNQTNANGFCCCACSPPSTFSFSPPRFPFLTMWDEGEHFGLLVDYSSRWEIPRTLEPMSMEARHYIAVYGSTGISIHDQLASCWHSATHDHAAGGAREISLIMQRSGRSEKITRATQPPLYYFAGKDGCCGLGKAGGFARRLIAICRPLSGAFCSSVRSCGWDISRPKLFSRKVPGATGRPGFARSCLKRPFTPC